LNDEQPQQQAKPRRKRTWLVVTLVLLGLGAALAVGYVVGESSRDDDVNAKANKAQQALEEEQTEDAEAVAAITGAFQSLVDQAVTELRGKINDAIGSAGGESP
jgi:hypothetical protein